jgi:hypothetical protein
MLHVMTGTSIYRWLGTLQTMVRYGRPGVNMKLAWIYPGARATSYVELAGAYIKAGLLKPAKEVIKKAWSLLNDVPEIIASEKRS